ncbi:MAG TPA: hypothetical protein VNO21_24725, partial [Polyangiaceae bacterium]|nr:hypothetical protein [Polyangiaceae bacterium]
LVLAGIFRLMDGRAGRRPGDDLTRKLALHLVTQILVLSFLVHLWTLGYEGRNAVFGGILPLSDSNGFYDDALRLVHGARFLEQSSKRPLFSTVFAALLKVSGSNLRFALLACAVVGAWAVAFAALEVWKSHGAKSAFVVYLILLFFERRWTGFVQTEHFGLPLGVLGFVLVWRANEHAAEGPSRQRILALTGLFAIALALMARAGAFFVLPALLLWAARRFTRDRKAFARTLAWGVLAMVAAYGVHTAVLRMVGKGVTFSDYPAIVYGLVHREDYTYLGEKHPELVDLQVTERVAASWNIVIDDARAHPGLVVIGLVKSGAGLFTSPFGMFSYVWTNPDDAALEDSAKIRAATESDGILGPFVLWRRTFGTYSLLNACAMALIGAGFVLGCLYSLYVVFVRERARAELSLLRHAIVGVVVSAPFTPPWITSGQQVQTATLAFVAALPAVALLSGLRARDAAPKPTAPPADASARDHLDKLAYVPPALVAVLFLLAIWLRARPEAVPACPASGRRLLLPFPETVVTVTVARSMHFGDKAIDDLRFSLVYLAKHNRDYARDFTAYLRPGTRYLAAYDACDARTKIIIDDAGHVPALLAPDPPSSSWRAVDATELEASRVLHIQ